MITPRDLIEYAVTEIENRCGNLNDELGYAHDQLGHAHTEITSLKKLLGESHEAFQAVLDFLETQENCPSDLSSACIQMIGKISLIV